MSWAPFVWLKNQLGTLISDGNAEMSTTVENNTKWYYSGDTGTTKTLLRNVEFLNKEITLSGNTTVARNSVYIVGRFIPRVSGWHTVKFEPDTMNANDEGLIALATMPEFMNAAIIYNQNNSTTWDYMDTLFSAVQEWSGTYGVGGISRAYPILKDCLENRSFSTGDVFTVKMMCKKDEPVYFWACNSGSTDITLWSNIVTVTYNLTEPYQY